MKVLVTGGAGYIGSVTSELLLDAGHEVLVFDHLYMGHRAAVDVRAAFVHGDLREADAIAEAKANGMIVVGVGVSRDAKVLETMGFDKCMVASTSEELARSWYDFYKNSVLGSIPTGAAN